MGITHPTVGGLQMGNVCYRLIALPLVSIAMALQGSATHPVSAQELPALAPMPTTQPASVAGLWWPDGSYRSVLFVDPLPASARPTTLPALRLEDPTLLQLQSSLAQAKQEHERTVKSGFGPATIQYSEMRIRAIESAIQARTEELSAIDSRRPASQPASKN
jgi:hypothetical protein